MPNTRGAHTFTGKAWCLTQPIVVHPSLALKDGRRVPTRSPEPDSRDLSPAAGSPIQEPDSRDPPPAAGCPIPATCYPPPAARYRRPIPASRHPPPAARYRSPIPANCHPPPAARYRSRTPGNRRRATGVGVRGAGGGIRERRYATNDAYIGEYRLLVCHHLSHPPPIHLGGGLR
jgi:hypothetical protein